VGFAGIYGRWGLTLQVKGVSCGGYGRSSFLFIGVSVTPTALHVCWLLIEIFFSWGGFHHRMELDLSSQINSLFLGSDSFEWFSHSMWEAFNFSWFNPSDVVDEFE